MIDLFQPPRPPEVRDDQVSRTHTLGIAPQKPKEKRVYYVGRTEAQKARRRELQRIRKQMRRRKT
jgi:hypothetical protein